MKSPFEVLISSEAIQDESERYEFTLQWNNPDCSQQSKWVLGETEGGRPNNEDNSDDENNSDQDNGDNDNNDDNTLWKKR